MSRIIYSVIMRNGAEQRITFAKIQFKSLIVWNVIFDNGQNAMLYKVCNEWMQHNESELDRNSLMAVGEKIDHSLLEA